MIPKPISGGGKYWNLYFMAYYFPFHLLKELGGYETVQNKLTREWILKLKNLTKKDSVVSLHKTKREFKLFNFLLESFIKKLISHRTLNGRGIGLMAIPGSYPRSHNAVSLLIKNFCYKNSNFIDLSPAIIRESYVNSKNSTHENKVASLNVDINVLEKFFMPSHEKVFLSDGIYDGPDIGHIIIIDDVYTTGGTLSSVSEKLFSAGDEYGQFFCHTRLDFLAFGKTLLKKEIIENKFSDPKYEIKLPNLGDDSFMNKDIKTLEASLKNSLNELYLVSLDPYDYPDLFDFSPARVSKGQVVYHPTFGLGYITGFKNASQGPQVDVDFAGYGSKTLVVSLAKLKTREYEHGD